MSRLLAAGVAGGVAGSAERTISPVTGARLHASFVRLPDATRRTPAPSAGASTMGCRLMERSSSGRRRKVPGGAKGGPARDSQVCRPPALPNPKGVLSPGDLEGPYHSRDGPRTPDLEDGATTTPLLLGFDAKRGRGAAIVIDEIATVGEGCPRDVRGEVFDLRTGRALSREALGRGGACEALEQATARYAAALPKLGFSPARDLVDRVTERYANDAFAPLAVLDSPLCGWMIHVKADEAQRRFTVALVSPANDERHELGSLPFGDACMFYDEHKRCALRAEYRHPIVHQVALTPDRSRLYVSIGATHGGHNDPIRFHRGVYLLPRGVLSHENGASR